MNAINRRESYTVELARDFKIDEADSPLEAQRKKERAQQCERLEYVETRCPPGTNFPPRRRTETLFVNATVRGYAEDSEENLPWVVEIELPKLVNRSPPGGSWFHSWNTSQP